MRWVERWVLGKHWKTRKPLKVYNLFTRLSSRWQTKSCRVTLSLWHLWAKVASTEYGPRLETLECYNISGLECYNISGNVDISRQTLVTLVTICNNCKNVSRLFWQNDTKCRLNRAVRFSKIYLNSACWGIENWFKSRFSKLPDLPEKPKGMPEPGEFDWTRFVHLDPSLSISFQTALHIFFS